MSRFPLSITSLAITLALAAVGCGSSTQTTTGPSPVKCQVALTASVTAIDTTGGTGTIRVATQPECTWTAAAEASWISGVSPTSGQGSGEVAFQVPANPTPTSRQGDIVINDNRVRIEQAAAPCTFEIAPRTTSVDRSGGAGRVTVWTTSTCAWTATSQVDWIRLTSSADGTGSGAVSYDVPENTGPARSGSLTISGQPTLFTQAGATASPGCTVVLSPPSLSVPVAGAVSLVTVTAGAGCAWSATSGAPWIAITSAVNGVGNGTVTLRVEANPAGARTGTLAIAGQTYGVTQAGVGAGACAYTINPTGAAIPATGGTGPPISVSTTAGCAWTATSNASWISIASGANGGGSGAVGFSVAANTGGTRSGVITVAGETFTVTQAAPASCAYAINSTSQSISAEGGAGTPVAVSTAAACAWTATSNAHWITVTTGANGSGSGSVSFSVATNTGSAHTGTITIAGETFTVTQAAPASCTYTINATSQSIGADGGAGTPVAVSTAAACAWTATSNAAWITITAGANGSGNGPVSFSVATNTGSARTGTITIAGETFTVTQAAPASCAYTINPTSQSIGADGGAGTPVAVSTAAGCAWTATSSASWITITSGVGGSGNGSVSFTVDANTGIARSGTLTIAGATFSVTQAAGALACSYAINATSQSMGAGGGPGTSVTVVAADGCAWSATSNASWIAIATGASGSGNGTVTFTVAANVGGERSGTLTIAGQTFTVTQAGVAPCTYQISPTSASIPAGGGATAPVTVSTAAECAWTATTTAAWITVTSGASGTGGGTVTLGVAPNTGDSRTGTVTIAGQTFTVSQEATPSCKYELKPTSVTIGAAGSLEERVEVSAKRGCAWTATSNELWIVISSGASGEGDGTVRYVVLLNPLSTRTGTITIAGQTFTVTQAGLLF